MIVSRECHLLLEALEEGNKNEENPMQNESQKKIAFGNKEHTKSRKSEARFDWVSSYATLYM